MIPSYPVSNERTHHGWVQRKIFNIWIPRWPENGVLGAFVANSVQKEYLNVSSQKGKSLVEGREATAPVFFTILEGVGLKNFPGSKDPGPIFISLHFCVNKKCLWLEFPNTMPILLNTHLIPVSLLCIVNK